MAKTLIKDAIIVNPSLPAEVIPRGWLEIDGSTIGSLGPGDPPEGIISRAHRVVVAQGKILLPGLVNAHVHGAMSLLRGIAEDLPLKVWLEQHIFPAEARAVDEEFVYWGTLLSCAEMLLSGTTTFADGYFFEQMVVEAAKTSGMRAVAAQGIVDFPVPGCKDPTLNVQNAMEFIKSSRAGSLITPAVFCHSPYSCSPKTILRAKELCRDQGVPFFIHVAETRGEVEEIRTRYGFSPGKYLFNLGVVDEATVLVHGVWLDESELDLVARAGAGVVTCTESNMKLGVGIAPLKGFVSRGIKVGLGTDGPASNNDLDLFSEMDLTAKLHKVFNADPTILKADEVLWMATRGGAAVLGLDRVGLLQPGFEADLILVDAKSPHMVPLYNPVSQLVYAARGSDVHSIWVHGIRLVEDRRILSFDVLETIQKAQELALRAKPLGY